MTYADTVEAYQNLLEARRGLGDYDPHELREEVDRMLEQHEREMEIAWMKELYGYSP